MIELFKDMAIIILAAEFCGIVARKIGAPQVVGAIVAGLLIGPSVLNLVEQSTFITNMAEVGVVFLMFMAGLETDLKELIKTGPIAFLVAVFGVAIPCVGGYFLYSLYYGFAPSGTDKFYEAIFIGVIITATSVSITVQTLREIGHLKGRVGTTILSAAIIDDVIGIILLTFVIGFKNPDMKPNKVITQTLLFFAFAIVVGFIIYKLFKLFDRRYKHHQRIPITGLAICLFLAYAAEHYFGIADITGAYVAGIVLCNIKDSEYIARKIDINSYMVFGPIFFASIGLKTQLSSMNSKLLIFSILFILVALVTKIIGCGFIAKVCRFGWKDSLKIGVGMMTRGEVALIVAGKGASAGIIQEEFFTCVILLILVSSICTPIILKFLYKGEPAEV